MIREEINAPVHLGENDCDGLALTDACTRAWGRRHNFFHPQISVTDEMGGQVTLVTSESSRGSASSLNCTDPDKDAPEVEMDELGVSEECDFPRPTSFPEQRLNYQDTSQYDIMMYESEDVPSNPFTAPTPILPSFIVSPCDPSRPSIVRGIGKGQCSTESSEDNRDILEGTNAETEDHTENHNFYRAASPASSERRESFTLSKNASLRRTFPPFNGGLGSNENPYLLDFNNVLNNSVENGRTLSHHAPYRNVFASDLMQISASGSFQVTLSDSCAQLATSDVLGIVKDLIDRRTPREFIVGGCGDNGLNLEYPGGVQIELRVCKGELKMRRISGDHHQYSELCRELISCMTV